MTSLAVLAAAVGATAQQEFATSGGHGSGHYYYNGSGAALFWFFFIVVLIFLLFGCVGGVWQWGGHTHTVHIGRIVNRDANGNVVSVRDERDTTVTVADEDPYYGNSHHHHNDYVYTPSVQPRDPEPFTQGSNYGNIPTIRNEAGIRVQIPAYKRAHPKQPLKLIL